MNTKFWVALLAWSIALPASAGDEWIDLIPADAKAAVIVRDAKPIERIIQAYFELDEEPLLADMSIDEWRQKAGFGEQLNLERGAALVVVEPGQRGIVVMIPVADEQAALRQLNAESAGKHFHKVIIQEKKWMVFAKPGALMAAANAELLQPFRKATRSLTSVMSKRQRILMLDVEFYAHVNVAEWRPFLHMGPLVFETGVMADPFFREFLTPLLLYDDMDTLEILQFHFGLYRMLVDQTKAVAIGIGHKPERTIVNVEVNFETDSPFRQLAAQVPPGSDQLLAGLPAKPFLGVLAMDVTGFKASASYFFDSMLRMPAIEKRFPPGERRTLLQRLERHYAKLRGFNAIVEFDDLGINYLGRTFGNGPELTSEQFDDALDAFNVFLFAFGPMEFPKPMSPVQIGELKAVESKLTVFKVLKLFALATFDSVYGPSPRLRMAAIDNTIAVGAGSSDNPLALIDGKSPPLMTSPRIKPLLEDFPNDAFAVAFLDPYPCVSLVERPWLRFITDPRLHPQFAPPAEPVSPIGIAASANSDGFRFTVVVRFELWRALAKSFRDWAKAIADLGV